MGSLPDLNNLEEDIVVLEGPKVLFAKTRKLYLYMRYYFTNWLNISSQTVGHEKKKNLGTGSASVKKEKQDKTSFENKKGKMV